MSRLLKLILCQSILVIILVTSGCSMLSPAAKKPEIGPTGKPTDSLPNPPITERFSSPPGELYDLEATAGVVFEGINKLDWGQTEAGFNNLNALWEQTKPLIGEKKGVKDADEALQKLALGISDKKADAAFDNLNKFMGSISDIGKSYKLSPLSDIIAVSNSVRNVSYYVEDKDWSKAAAKVKELEGIWQQAKPSMEKVGILGEITKTHATINQMKDAVNGENKGAFEEQAANINDSMGRIRQYYRGK